MVEKIDLKKIFVVDDNKDIRLTVKANLENMDSRMQVFEFSSGNDCIDALENFVPDLILLDIMMPGIDGMDAAIKIKENITTKNVPIVFLTAKTDKMSKGMGEIAGEDYIEKPFEPQDLYNRVMKILEGK